MNAVGIIRVIGEEFNDINDTTLEKWIEIVSPMVSKSSLENCMNRL